LLRVETVWRPEQPVDVRLTLGPLSRGRNDPTHKIEADGSLWRTSLTPTGPATYRVAQRQGEVHVQAWGDGAEWVIAQSPAMLGRDDDWTGFVAGHPLLEQAWRRHPGLRLPRTALVMEQLVPAVLEQKVTGKEARQAYCLLARRYGSVAPGPAPAGMRVVPSPDTWRRIPSWEWHKAGVDPQRMRTVMAACRVAGRLEETVAMSPADALTRLRAVPGIGEWTAAEVAQRALGDADAVSVGDYHLAAFVGWALLGRPLDDPGMVELLEPWRPHRQRVVRLIEISGARKPRFGPRMTIQDHRSV
ncbi:MAG: DNA-3-methyladenine glycosylase 2 family protein, partial [Frankiales bacterium]|nr:DNA-3-methyladenine glycosylase 2 family protein [Frankiales bacterium]